jgi:hypothetical protein
MRAKNILCNPLLESPVSAIFYATYSSQPPQIGASVELSSGVSMMYCTVQYSKLAGSMAKAHGECIAAIVAATSLTMILPKDGPKNVVCGQHLIVRTKVFSSQGDFMNRRNFLSRSLAASALSLAAAGDLPAQVGSTADQSAPQYMDLRRYHLANGSGVKLTTAFFADALIPALNRLGIGPVGAFSVYFGPDSPSYYLLMPSSKLETLVTADLELAKDDVFMKAAAPFWDAPAATPPYVRIESSLLRAFPGYPKVTPPASAATKGKRIYQLRQYQSPTNMDHVRKVEMFHNGEFGFFAKAGAAGVFYADTLVGPNLPNLTYMLSFPDMPSLEADWEKFSADPDWKKLSADSRFNLDPPTVSSITSLVLHPLTCSQV